jgi:hypothetical protein
MGRHNTVCAIFKSSDPKELDNQRQQLELANFVKLF